MKTLFAIFFLIVFGAKASGQSESPPAPPQTPALPVETAAEADEAFKRFDFNQLKINPNNLTPPMIEDLRANFLPEVKPFIIKEGDHPKRLTRIAAPVLRFHKTNQSEIIVFTHSVPIVFTWKETFITVSTAALDLLTDDEIAALLSHEVGHLYFAENLAKARTEKDDRTARVVELKCDLAALHTLSKLKMNPANLMSAVEKLVAKREQLRVNSFQAGSPSLENRERVYRRYVAAARKKR